MQTELIGKVFRMHKCPFIDVQTNANYSEG